MRSFIRSHLTYANVMATIAVFMAMAGTGIAAKSYVVSSSKQIKDGAVTGADVKNSSLTGSDIKNKSLTAADFTGSVQGPQGIQGTPGIQGPKGETGATGLPGPIEGTPAGGALAGTYPNPQVAADAVNGSKVLDESLTLADMTKSAGATATFGGSVSIPARECFATGLGGAAPAGSLVIQSVYAGTLPSGLYLPAYTTESGFGVRVRVCNQTGNAVGVPDGLVVTARAIMLTP